MIDMTMAPDGSDRRRILNATENVRAGPAGAGHRLPAKTIKASTLAAAGEGGRRAADRHVRGSGRLPRGPGRARGLSRASIATAPSKRLIVHTKPGLGDLQQAEFRGNVKFVDGAKIDRRGADRHVSGRPGSSRPLALDDRPGAAADRDQQRADRARADDLDDDGDAEAEGRDGRPKRHGPEARRRPRARRRQAAQDAKRRRSCRPAEAGSAGDGPIEPARVRRRSVARALFGMRHD